MSLLQFPKPIKTDRKSIVDSGGLDITSRSLLKWPFMPKQGPRSSTVQYCTVLYSTVQYFQKGFGRDIKTGSCSSRFRFQSSKMNNYYSEVVKKLQARFRDCRSNESVLQSFDSNLSMFLFAFLNPQIDLSINKSIFRSKTNSKQL